MANISNGSGLPSESNSGRLAVGNITSGGGNGTIIGTVPSNKLWVDVTVAIMNRDTSSTTVELAINDGALASNVADEDWLTNVITLTASGVQSQLTYDIPVLADGEKVQVRAASGTVNVSCSVFGHEVSI